MFGRGRGEVLKVCHQTIWRKSPRKEIDPDKEAEDFLRGFMHKPQNLWLPFSQSTVKKIQHMHLERTNFKDRKVLPVSKQPMKSSACIDVICWRL